MAMVLLIAFLRNVQEKCMNNKTKQMSPIFVGTGFHKKRSVRCRNSSSTIRIGYGCNIYYADKRMLWLWQSQKIIIRLSF